MGFLGKERVSIEYSLFWDLTGAISHELLELPVSKYSLEPANTHLTGKPSNACWTLSTRLLAMWVDINSKRGMLKG